MIARRSILVRALAAAVLVSGGAWLHASAVGGRTRRLDVLQEEHVRLAQRLQGEKAQRWIEYLKSQLGPQDQQMQEDLTALLQQLADDLNELKIQVRSLTTGAHSPAGAVRQAPLSLSCQGPLAGVFDLLKRINEYRPLTRIERLTITREPASPIDELSVSMRLETFGPAIREAPSWVQASESR